MPYFFASLKIAITLAFVGSVISVLWHRIFGIVLFDDDASATFRVPLVFVRCSLLLGMGIIMYAAAAVLEWRFAGWAMRT